MDLKIPEELEPMLEELARLEVLGESAGEVAVHLLREGIAREMRGRGLLRHVVAALAEEGTRMVHVTLASQVDEEFEDAAGKALRT